MDALASLLLVAGSIIAILAALGFWTWRRAVRGGRPAIANTQSGVLALHRVAGSLTVEDITVGPPATVRGAAGAESGHAKDQPYRDPAAAVTSLGEIDAQVRISEIAPPVSQQHVENDHPQEHADEGSEPSEPTAPPVPAMSSPTAGGAPPDELPGDGLRHSGGAPAAAHGETPTERGAAAPPDRAPTEPPASTARPKIDDPPALPAAGNCSASNAADPAEAREARPADAMEDARADFAGPAGVAEAEPLAETISNDGMPPVSAGSQSPCDRGADAEGTAAAPNDGLEPAEEPETETGGGYGEKDAAGSESSIAEPESGIEAKPPSEPWGDRASQPAVHRDRRGKRRAGAPANAPSAGPLAAPVPSARPPAEAKLRLSLHPIRRTARLSVVLTRPEGFPEHVTLQIGGQRPINAYNAQRYDDLDLPWTGELLEGEFRVASAEGLQWLRSARQLHIFAEDPSEPDLISVGAVRSGAAHAVICRSDDALAVRDAAASTGSPELTAHERWQGIPDGWTVLSGYRPVHAAALSSTAGLRPLDPGAGLEIGFEDGLAIRLRVFAEGHPPRIAIGPLPDGTSVTIGGQAAVLAAGGGWEAPGWNASGRHMVDVVPGPSTAYEIVPDPWDGAGWEFWNAYAGRFGGVPAGPWARAEICGASVRGPAGQAVLAVESQSTLIALGTRNGAVPLQPRADVHVSVGLASEPPAFLLSASGLRRSQGRVIWLGLATPGLGSRRTDSNWVAAVRMATSRRLPLEGADELGEDTWRKAKARARRLRRLRQ